MALREIVLDTETTGLDPNTGHKLVEIGCVEVVDRVRTGEVFHVYINPQRDMPEEAFRVHGLSAEFLSDKPLFKDVVDDFLAFVGDSPLVIHNAQFDMKFINYELKQVGKGEIPMERSVDTVVIARKKFPGSPANLDALCKRFNIDLSARTKHGALLDAELLADVYLELGGGRQSKLSLRAEHETTLVGVENAVVRTEAVPMRVFQPSVEELAAHEAFVAKKLKNALWLQIEQSPSEQAQKETTAA